MIDLHSHLLPGVDDGIQVLQDTIEALAAMAAAGVTKVALTPHYMQQGYPNTAQALQHVRLKTERALKQAGVNLEIVHGCEVYLEAGVSDNINNYGLNLAGTKWVLVETGLNGFPKDFYDIAYKVCRAGYYPLLAHPERYTEIMHKPERAEELIHHNMFLQVNAGSLLGAYGKRSANAAWYILEQGWAHVVASDCHSLNGVGALTQAYQAIAQQMSPVLADLLCVYNPADILANKRLEPFYPMPSLKPPAGIIPKLSRLVQKWLKRY